MELELETRDLSPEEAAKVDDLLAMVGSLNEKMDQVLAKEDQEGEGDVDKKVDEDMRSAPSVLRSKSYGRRSSPIDVHDHAKRERYSVSRAASEWLNRGGLFTGVEAEVNQELTRNSPCREGQFKIPADFNKLNVRADQTTTTGTGAIPTYWQDFVEYLYPIMVGPKLGFNYMTGLASVTKLPRQTSIPTVTAVAEASPASQSNAALDNVTLTPRQLTAAVNVSRAFLKQSIIAADQYIMSTGAEAVAYQLDQWAITGSGSGAQPTGLLNNSAVTAVQVAASNAFAYTDLLAMIQAVDEANAKFDKRGWLTSPKGYQKGKSTPKLGTTFPEFCISNDGTIDSEPVVKSSQVPKTLSYTGVSSLTALIYGNWSDLIVAQFFEGVEVLVDPYSGSAKGDVNIVFYLAADTAVRHGGSFAILPNIA